MKSVSVSRPSGFTIVELLIVIVVIAILAAISVVAYTGIQARTENTKTINGVAAYTKIFSMYAADEGTYPSTGGYPCLGEPTSNTCAKVVTGPSGACNWAGGTSVNATFDALLTEYISGNKPSISSQAIECNGDSYRGAYVNANSSNPRTLQIAVFLKGNVSCPENVGSSRLLSRIQADQATRCLLAMPTL